MDQNRVVIIGGDHQNTLGVIRAFGANGYITDVIIHHFPMPALWKTIPGFSK